MSSGDIYAPVATAVSRHRKRKGRVRDGHGLDSAEQPTSLARPLLSPCRGLADDEMDKEPTALGSEPYWTVMVPVMEVWMEQW